MYWGMRWTNSGKLVAKRRQSDRRPNQRGASGPTAGGGVDIEEVLLGGGEGALDDEAKVSIDRRQAVAEVGEGIAIEDGQFCRFDGLDVKT